MGTKSCSGNVVMNTDEEYKMDPLQNYNIILSWESDVNSRQWEYYSI